MRSRKKIGLGCLAMALAMIGDFLLGWNTIGTGSDPDAVYGLRWNVVPDWRYALSSVLGLACAALFAVAASELIRVMDRRDGLRSSPWYRLFRIANWTGIISFAFIHIGICMLPVVFNAGMAATGDVKTSADMAIRVAKSIAVPLAVSLIAADGFVVAGWVGMILKGQIPVKKWMLVLNPLALVVLGQLLTLVPLPFKDIDSGSESFGWLLMYAACARYLGGGLRRMRA